MKIIIKILVVLLAAYGLFILGDKYLPWDFLNAPSKQNNLSFIMVTICGLILGFFAGFDLGGGFINYLKESDKKDLTKE